MQDFLKDRPVLGPDEATIIAPAPAALAMSTDGPFARIVRDAPVTPPARPAAAPASGTKSGAPDHPATAEHSSQVKTVIENGRIARLIVTCSCGKVTEIACVY